MLSFVFFSSSICLQLKIKIYMEIGIQMLCTLEVVMYEFEIQLCAIPPVGSNLIEGVSGRGFHIGFKYELLVQCTPPLIWNVMGQDKVTKINIICCQEHD